MGQPDSPPEGGDAHDTTESTPAAGPADRALETTRTIIEASGSLQQLGGPGNAAKGIAQVASRAAEATSQIVQASAPTSQAARIASTIATTARAADAALEALQSTAREGGRHQSNARPHTRADAHDGSDRTLPRARFEFRCDATTNQHWRVVRLDAEEALSVPYQCIIDLANEDIAHADPGVLLGASCALTIARDDETRRFCGIASRVERLGTRAGNLLVRVHLVPAVKALDQRVTCAIFQSRTVPQIVESILRAGLAPWHREFRAQLTRTYPVREYCVQYNESDLAFVTRLLADEGIAYHFDHSGDAEVLVLTDANEAFTALGVNEPFEIRGPNADTDHRESVRYAEWSDQLQPTSSTVADFDWTRPAMRLRHEARSQDARGFEREVFAYPAPLTIGEYREEQRVYTSDDRRTQAELRRQAMQLHARHGTGQSNITALQPGSVIALQGHRDASLNRRLLVTRVEHRAHAPDELTSDSHDLQLTSSDERYTNAFVCVPSDVVYRPDRLAEAARPRIVGPQTAIVTGPEGSEIHTDEHGRIKVQFHWDRAADAPPERRSCWVRVAQSWAGPGWGTQFTPRVGMEVVVAFLEGNPDRPLVTGCVYNGAHTHPYQTPAHETQSGIKTRSSPRSEGFNELRFEDAAGQEEVFLHAQRNLTEVVERSHATRVGANQNNHVAGAQDERIGALQRIDVGHNRMATVHRDDVTQVGRHRVLTIGQNDSTQIRGTRQIEVDGRDTETYRAERHTSVATFESLEVSGRRYTRVGAGNDDLEVQGHLTTHATGKIALTGDEEFRANQGDVSVTLNRGGAEVEAHAQRVRLHNSSGSLEMDSGIHELSAQRELVLRCGSSSIRLRSDGTIEIIGNARVRVQSGEAGVTCEPSKVAVRGPEVASQATSMNEISGAVVRIN